MKSGLTLKFKSADKAVPAKSKKKNSAPVEGSPEEEASETPEFEKYEVEGAADTIMKAHEHMADDKMMKHVDPILDKKRKAIKSLDDLRALAKSKLGSNRIEG